MNISNLIIARSGSDISHLAMEEVDFSDHHLVSFSYTGRSNFTGKAIKSCSEVTKSVTGINKKSLKPPH